MSLRIWKTSSGSCWKENSWAAPGALLPLWFCKHTCEKGLNVQDIHDVSSGIVSCSHWTAMLHLRNIISIIKKTFVPLPLFLNLSYLTLFATSVMITSSGSSLNPFSDLLKGPSPHLRAVKVFWHLQNTPYCLFLEGLEKFPFPTQLINTNSHQYCHTMSLFVAHTAIPDLQLVGFAYFLNFLLLG